MATFKQSTSYTHQFLMVLTDGVTGATGKNGSLVVKIGKNGATGVTAAGTTAEVDATNLPGIYSIAFTIGDLNTAGSFSLDATASGCNHTTEVHKIDSQVFTDLVLNGSGQVSIASNFKQNTIITIPFTMTVNGVPTPGLTITAQKNFGSGFSLIAGTVSDLGVGDYKATLQASDTNNGFALYRFTAVGADDRNIGVVFTP